MNESGKHARAVYDHNLGSGRIILRGGEYERVPKS